MNCSRCFRSTQTWQLLLLIASILIVSALTSWISWQGAPQLTPTADVAVDALAFDRCYRHLHLRLNPGLRSETRIVKHSRLPHFHRHQLKHGLRDQSQARIESDSSGEDCRIDEVIAWLSSLGNLKTLRQRHEVAIYRFGENSQLEQLHSFPKSESVTSQLTTQQSTQSVRLTTEWRWLAYFAMLILFSGTSGILVWLRRRIFPGRTIPGSSNQPALLAGSTIAILSAMILLALIDLRRPDSHLRSSLGTLPTPTQQSPEKLNRANARDTTESAFLGSSIDWHSELSPSATSTKLGDAIQTIVNKERGGPIAGIILVTDGRHNSGLDPIRATAAASAAGISIYPIGIGSIELNKNATVSDVQAPPRVFPADMFRVKGMIRADGLAGTPIQIQLLSVDEKSEEAETLEAETIVNLGEDGQGIPVEFKVSQLKQGKRRYIVRIPSLPEDLDPRDNEKGVLVEIIDRQTQVMLLAGGPTREFRFLRNQLYRDKDIRLQVWLQSATEGADQESHVLLAEFPKTREELYELDCIVAFDPDWRKLSSKQAALLERWVAEQAGGLIVVAGPVNTPEWTRRPRGDEAIDKIRRLYPVSFYNQGSAQLKLGRFGGDKPFPISFSREGRAAEFLWLGDSAADSQSSWQQFKGVFGYYAVNEPKSGADILANFSDPSTSIDDRLPIYLASQSYGGGRVFFQASGEMWRVRRLDVEYFRKYYTKLIRWASQGRLLRDSNRGILMTDRDRCWMGDQVSVQAMLRDRQDEPLMIPEIDSVVQLPDGSSQTLTLRTSENAIRPGSYSGRLSTILEGEYKISLPIPDSVELEILTTTVQAAIPDLEKEKPQRNDRLLSRIADKTNGHYYIGFDESSLSESNSSVTDSPFARIASQDQVTYLTGTLDLNFKRKLMMWLFTIVIFSLTMTWSIRRIHKLA